MLQGTVTRVSRNGTGFQINNNDAWLNLSRDYTGPEIRVGGVYQFEVEYGNNGGTFVLTATQTGTAPVQQQRPQGQGNRSGSGARAPFRTPAESASIVRQSSLKAAADVLRECEHALDAHDCAMLTIRIASLFERWVNGQVKVVTDAEGGMTIEPVRQSAAPVAPVQAPPPQQPSTQRRFESGMDEEERRAFGPGDPFEDLPF